MITAAGQNYILRYLAGQAGSIAQVISFGIGTATATVNDAQLQFEVVACDIDVVAPDTANSQVIFKGTLSADTVGQFKEIGLWSLSNNDQAGNYGSRIITNFDSEIEAWSTGTWQTTARVGGDALRLAPATSSLATTTLDLDPLDLSGYSNTEAFKFAYLVNNSNLSSLQWKFKTDNSNYFACTTTASAGYQIVSVTKGAFTITGTPDWTNIQGIDIIATATGGGAASVDLDAVRVEDTDTVNPDYVLIAREVINLTKLADKELNVELALPFDIV